MDRWTRPANFAGTFYPSRAKDLEKVLLQFDRSAQDALPEPHGEVLGIVSPHAGYIYSGGIAALSFRYASKRRPDTIVAIGLSHRYRLEGISILDATSYETPLGAASCDVEFAQTLGAKVAFADHNREAHLSEHSVETQLPFIRFYFPKSQVVEILTQDDTPPVPRDLGKAIVETAAELGRSLLIVSSTDLSHYPTAELAERIDKWSLESLTWLDPERTSKRIAEIEGLGFPEVRCAVCSKAAVSSGMTACVEAGAKEGLVLGYSNSGHVSGGDMDRVVGYGAAAWVG